MILETKKVPRVYVRHRNGKRQMCNTTCTIYFVRCDNCGFEFTRSSKKFDKRSSAHVCSNCHQKRFAQRQSAILRQYNKYDASSGLRL